ncbi:MazG nucleotide pyrophosphohydrolase domain-containing protein [Alicyclobacillus fastidiosus]|uniref:MazG nucleotide pyrophosphohydrolase domain-containing protein n=1 Tax=Alicyclobacillus fastidiosus TaxID=392011 RepID=A0ABV5ALM0_9BACL|nr:MazG nucleotide pyrophosphohydrolase domain-containing protein [Alicyclobacillus fastidiosus]WEH08501.1 MazG nucleotide pyrophosphohydrolase domain-containing protein [Alicyclobacillus fastidiosus]
MTNEEMRKTIRYIMNEVHQTAVSKGWYEQPVAFTTHIALAHSELSEALEADRKNYGEDKIAEELADVLIRTLDMAAAHNLDLAGALVAKMEKNKGRTYRHGGLKY